MARRYARRLNRLWNERGDLLLQFRVLVDVSSVAIAKSTNAYLYGRHNDTSEVDARARHIVFKYAIGSDIWKLPVDGMDGSVSVAAALPPTWRARFRNHGVSMDGLGSSIAWQLRQVRFLLHAVHIIVQLARYSWTNAERGLSGPYWIAHAFPNNCYPNESYGSSEYQLVPFILSALGPAGPHGDIWAVRADGDLGRSSLGIMAAPEVFPPLPSSAATACFVASALLTFAASTMRWLIGHVEAPALAKEAVELKYLKFLPESRLPNWYITTNSGCGAHPLWINEIEARGVKCAMIFYSINNQVLQFESDPRPTTWSPEHRLLNWSRYLVRDNYQVNWLRRVADGTPEIIPIGNIPMEDNGADVPELPKNAIAVFDITPLRDAFFAAYGERIGCLSDAFIVTFLMDVFEVLRDADITMVLKLKRERPSRLVGVRYRHCINFLRAQPGVVSIDPGIAAKRLVAHTVAAISLPFSSTGPTASGIGRPSIYYDPSGRLKLDHDVNHGIPVLRGRDELVAWVRTIKTQMYEGRSSSSGPLSMRPSA
jgi:hypothetical protein